MLKLLSDFSFLLMHGFSPYISFQTKAGPVLVAINPFKKVCLYGNDYIDAYKRKSMESPHVYAITDTAMREMIRGNLSYRYAFFNSTHN